MRAQDIDLREMLSFQPEEGKLLLNGRRMLVHSQQSFGVLAEVLSGHFGHDFTLALFAQFGYRCGMADYEAVGRTGDWDSEMDALASGPITHGWEGLVGVRLSRMEYNRELGRFHSEGVWHNSYEAANHLEYFGVSDKPVCASLTGYASGWCTAFFGKPVLAIEQTCVGKGDAQCSVLVREAEYFGAEAEPWRRALDASQESIARNLEARVRDRTRDLASLKTALDQHALVTVTDEQGRIRFVNDLFCRISQYDQAEVLGCDHQIFNSGTHPPEYMRELWETISRGDVWHGTLCNRARDGSHYWVDSTIVPMIGGGDTPAQFVQISTDITEQKRAEAKLVSAKETADQFNRAKSEFVATMSHEIRTPLNGVLGFTNLLADTELSDEQRTLVETIRGSGETLLALLNDILDFSKIEAGELALDLEVFDLRRTLVEVCELMQVQAREKGIDLTADGSDQAAVYAVGDSARVRQVLMNLVGNAVKFTAAGGVRVQVGGRRNGSINVEVTDTGIGISEDDLPKLFKKFSQAQTSTTRRYGGTGLGLAICKELVDKMGGEIGVRSRPGQGSTFWFTLPAGAASELPQRAADTDAAELLNWQPPAGRTIRVLLAEDNITNQMLAKRMLARCGCRVDVAATGREALDLWRRLPYDAVFMDCHMPDMDGLEVTAAIRRKETHADVAGHGAVRTWIIACTASVLASDREACARVGMDDFLAKPLKQAEMIRALQRVPLDTGDWLQRRLSALRQAPADKTNGDGAASKTADG